MCTKEYLTHFLPHSIPRNNTSADLSRVLIALKKYPCLLAMYCKIGIQHIIDHTALPHCQGRIDPPEILLILNEKQ
jgi:hypothetical protein